MYANNPCKLELLITLPLKSIWVVKLLAWPLMSYDGVMHLNIITLSYIYNVTTALALKT